MSQVHGTCVAINGIGVLLTGPPGSGKSDLALRLIDQGGRLVADDRTEIVARGGRLVASAPPAMAGILEVRGLGLLRVECQAEAPLGLVVEMVSAGHVERLPEAESRVLLGRPLPLIRLDPVPASAAAKVRLAIRHARGDIIQVP